MFENNKDYKNITEKKNFDVAIVGGGASGIATALAILKENKDFSICIIDKNESLGKKILATGNGRCNITNKYAENYNEVSEFLSYLGVFTKELEEGRIYPCSMQASSVVELFLEKLMLSNIHIIKKARVFNIQKVVNKDCFKIDYEIEKNKVEKEIIKKEFFSKKVVVATGGKAGIQWGCTGDGYKILEKLSHNVLDVRPALTSIKVKNLDERLNGVRSLGKVSLLKNKEVIKDEMGEIQFLKDRISGICVFNLSEYILLDKNKDISLEEKFGEYEIKIDLLPKVSKKDFNLILKDRRCNQGEFSPEYILKTIVNSKIGEVFISKIANSKNIKVKDLTDEDIEKLSDMIKDSKFKVKGTGSWKESQVTAGGIPVDEIDLETMESKIIPDLYIVGEIINWQGICGGYNLNFAWHTGLKCGRSIASDI